MAKKSRFERLAEKIAREYEAKGIPKEKAEEWGRATAAKIGFAKYGKKEMERRAQAARKGG